MTLGPLQQGGAPTQPMIHYLFLDLDPLLLTLKTHVTAQPTVYPHELTQMGADGIMFNADRLTALLDDQEEKWPPALVICRYGSYFNCSQENARALQAVGWDLKKKGALDHRTLENLMERNLEQVGACNVWAAPKTLILATGELRPPTQSCIQAYLKSGWRVKLFCLQRCWNHALDALGRANQSHFTVVYLDPHLMDLLSGNTRIANSASTPLRGSSLLSRMSTNSEVWNEVSVRRSNLNSIPHARALALLSTAPEPYSSVSRRTAQMNYKEKDIVERRRNWMAMLPKVYTPGNRQRYIFMNLDDIAGALFTSHTLYQRVDGATDPRGVRLNFRALTKYLRGDGNLTAVECQVATYCKTSPCLVHALIDFGWMLKPVTVAGDDKGLHYEMMSQLIASTSTANGKTLVLAISDGGLDSSSNKTVGYREIICKFLEQRWYVEVHAWLHALNDGLLELQVQYPGRVTVTPLDEHIGALVYLKHKENANAFSALDVAFLYQYPSSTRSTPLPRAPSIESASFVNRETSSVLNPVHRGSSSRLSPPLPPPLSPAQPTVGSLQQQLQQMQDAFAMLQTSILTQQQLQQQNQELERTLREQANDFEEERKRQAALTAQQASDARFARRLQLQDREESLTCPITCELYKGPVTTVCCGKTFSAEVVKQVEGSCPWCRKDNFSTHPNRDVAELVEQLRAERNAFDGGEHSVESDEEKDAEEE